jgi:DNA-binding CsgD family transcriptional regulator
MVALLERTEQLNLLGAALDAAQRGAGRVVLLSGEAGIGKSALVERFVHARGASARVLLGRCDPLFTPRPLGPFLDIAAQQQPELLAHAAPLADWRSLAATALAWLRAPERPVLLIVEDLHWADEATLDLLTYLGRRIHQTSALLLVTYRDDELSAQHPLRRLLGALPPQVSQRLSLPPLSPQAVLTLAEQAGRPATDLHAITGGNPFFLAELLAHTDARVPGTVRDLVLARAAHLAPEARAVLELVAVAPGALEPWVLILTLRPEPASVDACLECGLLTLTPRGLSFRHELARRAVESAVLSLRAQELHAAILRALIDHDAEQLPLARLVHHAVNASDRAMVVQLAPRAAQQASAAGAHREAAAHYRAALRYRDSLPLSRQAELLEGLSYAHYLTGALDAAIEARREATAIWRQLGEHEREGDGERWLSRLHWFSGRTAEAVRHAETAVVILGRSPPGEALAMAYSNRAQLHMLAEEYVPAMAWGTRALALAEQLGCVEVQVHALTNIGTAALQRGQEGGWEQLGQALALALANEWHDHAARAYANLSTLAVQTRDYLRAEGYLDAGVSYTLARDLDSYSGYLLGWRARLRFEQGRWAEAEADARQALALQRGASVTPIPALLVLGHLGARRGEPDVGLLDQARELALPTGELQRIGPLAAARAEQAWWRGERERARAEAEVGYQLALHGQDRWMLGLLAFWLWQAGGLAEPPEQLPLPFAQMLAGEWRAAAVEWERIGAPFERGLALSLGNAEARLAALALFEQLGAKPAARMARQGLSAEGVQRVPRGPRPTTRSSPAGLTRRERDVLALLAQGLTNAEIAAALTIAPKTVGHHVAAILAKLGAHTRGQAVALAREQNLLDL